MLFNQPEGDSANSPSFILVSALHALGALGQGDDGVDSGTIQDVMATVDHASAHEIETLLLSPNYMSDWAQAYADADSGTETPTDIWRRALSLLLLAPFAINEQILDRVMEHLQIVHEHLSRRDWDTLMLHTGELPYSDSPLSRRTKYLLRAAHPDSLDYGLHRFILEDLPIFCGGNDAEASTSASVSAELP